MTHFLSCPHDGAIFPSACTGGRSQQFDGELILHRRWVCPFSCGRHTSANVAVGLFYGSETFWSAERRRLLRRRQTGGYFRFEFLATTTYTLVAPGQQGLVQQGWIANYLTSMERLRLQADAILFPAPSTLAEDEMLFADVGGSIER